MIRTVPLLVRAVLAVGVAFAGGLIWAEHAWAGGTVTPDHGARGDAAEVSLRVTDDRPGAYTTKIELRFPADTPVAEVYPMSVPDWAPSLTSRTVDQPLDGVHHGQVTEVVSAITWVRAGTPGADRFAELRVSMGPLPDAERLLLPVVQTYSDGTVVTWADPPGGTRPAAALRLLPAQAAAGTGEAPDPVVASAPDEPAGVAGQLGVALAAGLGGGAAIGVGYLVLTRRRVTEAADAEFAGGRWRLRE